MTVRVDRRPILSLVILSGILGTCACTGDGLAPEVTRAGVRSVKLGMDQNEVIALLGTPTAITTEGDDVVLRYHQRPGIATAFGKLWVRLRSGTLVEVYGKRTTWWVDDEEVFLLDAERSGERTPQFESVFVR